MPRTKILLNCVLLNMLFLFSANADWLSGELVIYEGQNYVIPFDGMNLTLLTMEDGSSLTWNDGGYNNNYVDRAVFSGAFSDMGLTVDNFSHALYATKTTFDNFVVNGHYNSNKPVITWGDQTSFWSNELTITGNVTLDTVQVGMESGSVKGVNFFDGVEAFNPFKSDYAVDTLVVWNGGLYKTTEENEISFKDAFYADLALKVSNGLLTQIDEMNQDTPVVGIGQSYSVGDVFQVIGTNEFLASAGLIDEYPSGQDLVTRILAFSVSGDMSTLTPENILIWEQLPFSYESGVMITDANVMLNHSTIMSTQPIDAMQRVAMGAEFIEIFTRLDELEGLLSDDSDFIEELRELDIENGPDEFWNKLRSYYYGEGCENEDIKQAYEDTDAVHTKYLKAASFAETLPVTIQNSIVTANNSSLQKHDSGTFVVDNSMITLYGYLDPIMPNNVGGSVSLLNHSGATGDIVIQNNSELNLYPYSNLQRDGISGNIYIIGSTINMMGQDTTYTDDVEDSGAAIVVNSGNIQLTGNSVLNAFGMENYVVVPESEYDFNDENWREQLKAKSLYINNSVINIEENSSLETGIASEDDEEYEDDAFGTIAMDVGSVINVHGDLGADVVSLNTDTDAGIVNLYNNAFIEGAIYRANVFVKSGAEPEPVNMYGRLALHGSTLDIGTNTLDFHSLDELLTSRYGSDYAALLAENGVVIDDAELYTDGFLYLNDSTIVTHIDLDKNTNGIINVEQLEFGDTPSTVKIVIDDGVLNPQGATFEFLAGDTDIGNNLIFSNVMYDITYDNGMLTLVPNGNSGIVSLDDLNDRLAATGWLSDGFEIGSRAKMIADALNEWAQTDPEAFKQAIKQIQPDVTPTKKAHGKSHNNQLANIVEAHMGHGNSHHGHSNKGNVGRGRMLYGRSGGDAFKNTSVWAQALYNRSKLDATNGFKGDTYGVALGTDTEINKNFRLGLGYAYANSDINTSSRDTDIDSHTAILYGQYNFGNAFVNGIATYGFNSYEERSNIKTANYDMDTIFAQAATGYNFYVGSFNFTPQTGLRYLWTNTHGYTDSAEQYISGNKTNTLTGVLGGTASFEWKTRNMIWQPSVKALAVYDIDKDADAVKVLLANGSSYVVSGSEFSCLGGEFGIGLNMNYKNFDLSLNYDIEVREQYTSQTGTVRAKYKF